MFAIGLTIINLILLTVMFIYFAGRVRELQQALWRMNEPSLATKKEPEPIKILDKPATKYEPPMVVIHTPLSSKEPNPFIDTVKRTLKHLFFTPLGLAKIGASVLLIGLVFLAKLMDDYGYFPLAMRMLSLVIIAIGLFTLGIILSKKRRQYASLLMGIGFATSFLTIFVSTYLFNLITIPLAVTLLVLISLTCITTSLYFKHRILTVVGLLGAFLSTLSLTNYHSPAFFLLIYYCILNILIFSLVLLCRWLRLAWLGLIASLLVGWYWYGETMPHLWQAITFIAVTFSIYLLLPLQLLKLNEKSKLQIIHLHTVNSILSLGLQYTLLFHHPYLLASATGIMTLLYGGLYVLGQKILWLSQLALRQTHLMLASLFLALTFANLFEFHTTGFIWAIQSTLLIYFGTKYRNSIATYIGVSQQLLLLIYLTGAFFFLQKQDAQLWLASGIVTFSLVFLSTYIFDTQKMKSYLFSILNRINFLLANIYLFFVVSDWILQYIPAPYVGFMFLIGVAIYSLIYLPFYKQQLWLPNEIGIYSITILYLLINIYIVMAVPQKLIALGFFIAYASTLAFYVFNKFNKNRQIACVFLAWMIFLTIILQSYNALINHADWAGSYLFIAVLLAATLGIWIVVLIKKLSSETPKILIYAVIYPFILVLSLFLVVVNPLIGPNVALWHYHMMINPLDLSVLVGTLTLIHVRKFIVMHCKLSLALLWIVIFVVLNSLIVRSIIHWEMIPYTFHSFIGSSCIQITLTALWSIIGFTSVILATLKKSRPLKICGISFIFVTVAKLFFIDFSQLHPLLRIAAFVGVGTLLLVLGYIATKTDQSE